MSYPQTIFWRSYSLSLSTLYLSYGYYLILRSCVGDFMYLFDVFRKRKCKKACRHKIKQPQGTPAMLNTDLKISFLIFHVRVLLKVLNSWEWRQQSIHPENIKCGLESSYREAKRKCHEEKMKLLLFFLGMVSKQSDKIEAIKRRKQLWLRRALASYPSKNILRFPSGHISDLFIFEIAH